MRQAGILAAAGLYALKHNIDRLKEDHQKANYLAKRIADDPNLEINLDAVQTNIILFKPLKLTVEEGIKRCKEEGLILSVGKIDLIRAVTHLDVSMDDIIKAADIIDKVF